MKSEFTIARFTLHYRAATTAFMPRFKCNVLRSAFGPAITRTLCGGKHHEHRGTLCPFARLFDGEGAGRLSQLTKVPPYIIECDDIRGTIEAGSIFQVIFLLISPDQFSGDDLEAVWRAMGDGLARPQNRFLLEQVKAEVITEADILARAETLASSPSLTIRLASPLLLRKSKKSQAIREPSFADLVSAAAQRSWALGTAWGSGCPAWASEEIKMQATSIETTERELRWIDWGRKSQRQGRYVEMGGVLGHLTVHGDLQPLFPLLAFAEVVHLGAGVTTGNGKIELSTGEA